MTGQNQGTVDHICNLETWKRLLFMLVFLLLLPVVRMVVWVIAVLQFLLVLFTGSDNPHLRDLGQGVAKWTQQALMFLTFNSEEKPFPFSDWPEIEIGSGIDEDADSAPVAESESVSTESMAVEGDDIPSFTTVEGEAGKGADDEADKDSKDS